MYNILIASLVIFTISSQSCLASPANRSSSLQQPYKGILCTKIAEGECHEVGKFAIIGDCTKYQNCIKGHEGKITPFIEYCPKEFYFNGEDCIHNNTNTIDCSELNCTTFQLNSESDATPSTNESVSISNSSQIMDTMHINESVPTSNTNQSQSLAVNLDKIHDIFPIKILKNNESLLAVTNEIIRQVIRQKEKNMTMMIKSKKITEEINSKIHDPILTPKKETEKMDPKVNEETTVVNMDDQLENETMITMEEMNENLTDSSTRASTDDPPPEINGKGRSNLHDSDGKSSMNSLQTTAKEVAKVNSSQKEMFTSGNQKLFYFSSFFCFYFLLVIPLL